MDMEILIASSRFMAIIMLSLTAKIYWGIAQDLRRQGSQFATPAYAVVIEGVSWATHQIPWLIWQLFRIAHLNEKPIVFWGDRISFIAYIGTAIAAVMVAWPVLSERLGQWAKLAAASFIFSVWCTGFLIALMWRPHV